MGSLERTPRVSLANVRSEARQSMRVASARDKVLV